MTTSTPTRGGSLTGEQRETLRAMLQQQRAFRVEQLMELHSPGRLDRLNRPRSSSDQEVVTSLTAAARAALRDVQNAIWRMDEGRYGRCTSCHETLDIARLEILPQAALCMRCQRAADSAAPAA